jgi:hypothetical protein
VRRETTRQEHASLYGSLGDALLAGGALQSPSAARVDLLSTGGGTHL